MKKTIRPAIFKWRQTEPEVILCAVRWYLRYSLSFRDVEELLSERDPSHPQPRVINTDQAPLYGSAISGVKQGFREFHAAQRTIQGYEAMHMIRKGQARWVSGSDVRQQIQLINKLFEVAA